MKKGTLRGIWIMFAVFMIIFVLNFSVTFEIPPTPRIWLVLQLWSLILSVVLLIRHKLPTRKGFLLSLLLGSLVALSDFQSSLFSLLSGFLITTMAALAVFSTFEHYREHRLHMLRHGKGGALKSIGWGLLVGVLWGVLNFFLMLSNNELDFQVTLSRFLVSLNPAILEEIAMRTLFFAFCLSSLRGAITTRKQHFTCWFMMIVPHVLIHTPEAFILQGLIGGLISIMLYIVIFGFIFAFLQYKRDVTSAMIAHGTVDFIRFSFFGLPM